MEATTPTTLSDVSSGESEVKYVVKVDGTKQTLDLEKVKKRFENRSMGLNMKYINFDVLVAKLVSGIY